MRTYVFSDVAKTYKVSYLTNALDGMDRLFINSIDSEVAGVRSHGLSETGKALGLPDEYVEISELALRDQAIALGLKLESFEGTVKTVLCSTECVLLSFEIPNGVTTIDEEAKTVEIAIGEDYLPITGLKPTFTMSDGATLSFDSVNQVSGVTTHDFTDTVTENWVVTAADGTTNEIYEITVTVVYK